jgi:DNA-binding NarL/FixJ family response regulator
LVECSRTAHLLVVGRPGGGGHGTLPDWSIPVHVAKRARCPVAVVPADWHPDEGGAPVSVGLDVPRHGMGILRQAFRVAQAQHRPLQVLHLWRPSSDALHRFPRPRMPEGAADWQLEPSVRRVQDAVGRVAGDFPGVVAHLVVKAEAPGPALEAASRCSSSVGIAKAAARCTDWARWRDTSCATPPLRCCSSTPTDGGRTRDDPVNGGVAMTEQSADGTRGPIRVFLLDDHEVVRRGITDLLEDAGGIEVVGESGLAEEAKRRIPAMRPHVAILDGRLPDGSGIDVCREIRSRDPSIAALILTSFDDDEAIFAAIMAGAAGYLLKRARGTDLVDTVRAVADGRSMLDPAVTAQVLERIRSGPPTNPVLDRLTAHEQRVLELIGEGLTNRQIATRLSLAEKTVKNYVSSLLAKLGLESRTQAAIFLTRAAQRPATPDS